MPSVIRKECYDSVQIFWLDRDLLQRNIREAVRELVRSDARVWKVVLFGSVAEGRALPSSDVDLLILVSETDAAFHERAARYSEIFREVGLGVDLFVYTRQEADRGDIPLLRTALERGKVLHEQEP